MNVARAIVAGADAARLHAARLSAAWTAATWMWNAPWMSGALWTSRTVLPLAVVIALSASSAFARTTADDSATATSRGSEDEASVWALLLPTLEAGEPDAAAVAKQIARAGPGVASTIAGILLGDSPEPEVAYTIHPLAIEMRRNILVDALKLLPTHDAIDGVRSRITSKTSVEARMLAIQVLSAIGGLQAFDGAIGIAGALEPIQWQRTFVQVSIEEGITQLVGRNPRLARRLARAMQDAPSGLAQIEARALSTSRVATAVPALLHNLGRDAELDLCILQLLEKLGDRCDPAGDPEAQKRMRALLDSEDQDVQRAALVALARVGDAESIPAMIGRLGSVDPMTIGSARWALETMTGEKLGLDQPPWTEWWAAEKAWAEETLPKLTELIVTGDAAQVTTSVDEAMSHRVHRHEVASAVKPALEAQDPAAQRLACEVLAKVGSPRALPWLLEKMESENEDVRRAAWLGLREITKMDVPADVAAWRLALAP